MTTRSIILSALVLIVPKVAMGEMRDWVINVSSVSDRCIIYAILPKGMNSDKEPVVLFGTSTYRLDEFIRSGRYCAIYGHRWSEDLHNFLDAKGNRKVGYVCNLCFAHRRFVYPTPTEVIE